MPHDSSSNLIPLESGTIEESSDGVILNSLSAGDTFGEKQLIFAGIAASTFTAMVESIVWVIDQEGFQHKLSNSINEHSEQHREFLEKISFFSTNITPRILFTRF